MKTALRIRIFILCGLLFAAVINAEVLLHVDFNKHTAGQHYNMAMARADFPHSGYTWYSSNLDVEGRGTIVQGRPGAGNALRLLYPAGEIGSTSTVQIRAALKEAVDTAWASYWVKFEDDEGGFDFVRGGKLPGLCGNLCITGGNDANGYNGWSARIMWRPEGVATQYMYYVTNQGYGEDLVFDKVKPEKRFIPGKWHRVNTQIIMNTPGIADGTIRSWFDGELSMERNNILIRHTDTLKINLFYISTFFGGSDLSWAPNRDTYITFDDFLVVSNPESSPYPQALYELSAISGRVPFEVSGDMSASLGNNVSWLMGPEEMSLTKPLNAQTANTWSYSSPGIYRIIGEAITNTPPRSDHIHRLVYALGERDLMSGSQWTRMPLGSTLRTGDTLRMYLTILDTDSRVIVGPVNTSEPGNLTQPQESLFFGVLQYENGIFSACSGSTPPGSCTYIPAPRTFEAAAYKIEFVLHGTNTALNTYDLLIYNMLGQLLAQWENMPRRGSAQSGLISNYGTWASRNMAAIVHMEPFKGYTNINTTPQTAPRKMKISPTVTSRKNGISLSIPPSLPSAKIEIFNAKGALVKQVSTDGKTANLFIPMKSRGLYLYRMKAGNDIFSGSVVVR